MDVSSKRGHWCYQYHGQDFSPLTRSHWFESHQCQGIFSSQWPWVTQLSSASSDEEVFHCILWRGCKVVSPGGPGMISLWLFQALVSHCHSGKPKQKVTFVIHTGVIVLSTTLHNLYLWFHGIQLYNLIPSLVSMDNPTYDEGITVASQQVQVIVKETFKILSTLTSMDSTNKIVPNHRQLTLMGSILYLDFTSIVSIITLLSEISLMHRKWQWI